MKCWEDFVARRRQRRGEIALKDNTLIIENGGKNSSEYRDRRRLVAAIRKLLPRVYAERSSTTLLRTAMIRPVKSIRRPPKLPFIHHVPGLAIIRLSTREVEAAILEFTYAGRDIVCACTSAGKAYRYYKLRGIDGKLAEFWMPIYNIEQSNISSSLLRDIKRRLEQIVPRVS